MSEHEHPSPPIPRPTEGLTPIEDRELAKLLKKWKGGRISTEVFTELARMIPQPIVEVVILRNNQGSIETLLIPRPEDDIVWPGKLHAPGAALRASDFLREDGNPLNGPFDRIQKGELKSTFVYTPIFVDRFHRSGDRGPEVAEIYMTELPEGAFTPKQHQWVPVEKLADHPTFIQHQRAQIMRAADTFREMMTR